MPNRFDRLTRSLATQLTRRQAVGAASLGLAAGAGLTRAVAQQTPTDPVPATPAVPGEAPERTFFLFVQTFSAGTMAPHATDPNLYSLTLTGHAAETIYFSDRPERIVGSVPTTDFLETLGFSPDNPPNAALVAGESVVVVELLNSVYSETFGEEENVTLTYDVVVLADYAEEGLAHLAQQAGGDLPARFAAASLFIDDCPDMTVECGYQDWGHIVGKIEGLGTCWSWDGFGCQPCDRGWGAGWPGLHEECRERFANCGSECFASLRV